MKTDILALNERDQQQAQHQNNLHDRFYINISKLSLFIFHPLTPPSNHKIGHFKRGIQFFDYKICMNQGSYTCVNCQLHFDQELAYKEHYKSEHHRYNVKRKLIALPPLSLQDYILQFQTELSSRSQSNSEIYCEVCSKKFMSPQTYKQHINSQRHKQNRKGLLYHSQDKSESSSLSEFQLIDEKAIQETCPFCPHARSEAHLAQAHCFPPFKDECTDLLGLIAHIEDVVSSGKCIYCENEFGSKDSVKQHMIDTGHAKLDLENFSPFQVYYLWKINESSEEEEEIKEDEIKEESGKFHLLNPPTLQSLQEKRLEKIKYGPTGVTINGKEVGYRAYRQYYKQFLTRVVQTVPREGPKAIENDWRDLRCIKSKPEFQDISFHNSHR